jgi:hypothetical protein
LAYTGTPYDPVNNPYYYGISDFGPFPPNMTGRNAFRGPGAWNFDLAAAKSFAVTQRVKAEFRAEAFNVFNHHNMYVNAAAANVAAFGGTPVPGTVSDPIVITGSKGGLGSSAIGGNHDERRFVQLAMRVNF